MRIYLDNCCYNRPFDDLTQERIHLESEAVLTILNLVQSGKLELIGSDVLRLEMSRMKDPIKRQRVIALYSIVENEIKYTDKIKERAEEIQKESNIKLFDSLHIASAEMGAADALLTTDDKLEKASANPTLKLRVVNPLIFAWEVLNAEREY